jgi:hypothetical protein
MLATNSMHAPDWKNYWDWSRVKKRREKAKRYKARLKAKTPPAPPRAIVGQPYRGYHRLSYAEALFIREWVAANAKRKHGKGRAYRIRAMAELFRVHPNTVRNIVDRRKWKTLLP